MSCQSVRVVKVIFDSCSICARFKESYMPIIAWLLGVPISVVLLLMLFGVF
jgi:hypothetical protein